MSPSAETIQIPLQARTAQPMLQNGMAINPLNAEQQREGLTQQQKPDDGPQHLDLRGGRGGMCPGRCCFIVPCPIPCDFCIIPL